jgi:acetylornithine deacetylase/succinyl-diaminopimelate desuccinylase-like protein
MIKKIQKKIGFCLVVVVFLIPGALSGEESLFKPEMVETPLVKKIYEFISINKDKIIEEWIFLTEIPAPSGHEAKRAAYLKKEFEKAGLDEVAIDPSGNAVGIWRGKKQGKKIAIPAHMDTVFQGVSEIKVKREGGLLKAPGICDDTASLINLLWTVRSLKHAGFEPENTYYFLGTVKEEVGFVGMREFMARTEEKFDMVIALDGDLGKVHYGALGFGGGDVIIRGPGAHTMQSRGIPNPNLAAALAIKRIYDIKLLSEPLEKWTILNIGVLKGGVVRNAVSQETSFTIDLRSASQEELNRAQKEIKKICAEVVSSERVEIDVRLNEKARAYQIPGARESSLVKTVGDILRFLKVRDIEIDPLGSTDANAGIEKGILSVNLGRTYGRFKHSLREEAEIEGIFPAMKQILLLICCLK